MLWSDLYDDMLDDLYQSQVDEVPFLRGCRASALIKYADEVGYNCGFNDWSDDLSPFKCPECGYHTITADIISNAEQDQIVQCGVCAGDEFECKFCGEVLDNFERGDDEDACVSCCEANKDFPGDDDNGE